MKILDRYILKEFLYTLVGVLFICVTVLLVYMLIESYEDILKNDPGFKNTVLYFANSLPFHVIEILPLAVGIAVLLTIGGFAKHNELTAMVAAGISSRRLSFPVLGAALLISFLTIAFNELAVPGCQERAMYIEKAFIEGKGEKILTRTQEIFVKGRGERFYVMDAFDSRNKVMTNPTVIDVNEEGASLKMRIDADRATLISKGEDGGRYWRFQNARKWTYDDSGRLADYSYVDEVTLSMEEDLDKFLSNRKKPEEMNLFELREYIRILDNRGEPVAYYKTDLYLKTAFPFASFIISIFCFAFGVKLESRNLIVGYALGVIAAIFYYAVTALTQAMGHKFVLPPLAAAWIPNGVFGIAGLFLLNRMRL